MTVVVLLSPCIKGYEFRCLFDTGAAVAAVNANVCQTCGISFFVTPRLDKSDFRHVTSLNGSVFVLPP